MEKIRENKGFTLVELLMTIVIIGIIITLLWGIVIFSVKLMQDNQNNISLNNNANVILAYLKNDLRGATEVKNDDGNWPKNSIELKIDLDDDGNYNETVEYELKTSEKVIERKVSPGNTKKLLFVGEIVNAKPFNFDKDRGTIQIDLKLENEKNNFTYSLTDLIYLRGVN